MRRLIAGRPIGTPHRLDMVDLADDRRLRAVLTPDYDVCFCSL
ncbi:MAG: hypothetical protein ACLQF1_15850 [Methyloceanibacter sp.]